MVCADSLAPQFVNNDYVTAESTFSTEHESHKVIAGLQTAACDVRVWAPPGKALKCCVWLCRVMLRLLLRLLHQPGENKHICSFYGSFSLLAAS